MRILIAEPLDFSPEAVRILETIGAVELRHLSRGEMSLALSEYDVCWFRLAHRIDRTMFKANLRCRLLATPVTGLDHIDLNACDDHGIKVVSLRGETDFLRDVRATAELTIALTLSLLRHIPEAVSSVKQGIWNRDLLRGRELFGKTVGIIGTGRLGRIVAEYFRAFGMPVLGYDTAADFPHRVARRATSLHELLHKSDVVSLHVPYAASTRHLIGRDELGAMKDGSILVNTSRGGVVDEEALLEALRSSHLGGAALDVLEGEPFITDAHPLIEHARQHSNLLIVPHIGGNTFESFEKTEVFLAERVVECLRDSTRKQLPKSKSTAHGRQPAVPR